MRWRNRTILSNNSLAKKEASRAMKIEFHVEQWCAKRNYTSVSRRGSVWAPECVTETWRLISELRQFFLDNLMSRLYGDLGLTSLDRCLCNRSQHSCCFFSATWAVNRWNGGTNITYTLSMALMSRSVPKIQSIRSTQIESNINQ